MQVSPSWVALSLLRHIGHKTLRNLLETFGTTDAILEASVEQLVQVKGVGKKIAASIIAIDLHDVCVNIERWQEAGIQIIPQADHQYPQILKAIPDPPLTLFARGQLDLANWQPAVAIVGTRKPSQQAEALAARLSVLLAHEGWTVVSGLAMGVDTAAHIGALKAKKQPTVAVLGGGVSNVYPHENRALAGEIMQRGVLISENAPEAEATAPRLVTRNRIISGLCQHVIVVETSAKGGAMHAAKAAQAQERIVHTVDWQVSGNQQLLQSGARPINPLNPVIPTLPSETNEQS